jgi:putative ATPase
MGLFAGLPEPETPAGLQPLAERMRPGTLDEVVGQEKLLGPGKPLRVQMESDNLSSMLFWGPPGCGKTTLARLIARLTKSEFVSFSAVLSGIKEIKEVMVEAERRSHSGARTIVFVDEVHRFNKAQQDAFLPHVEAGHILFIGATTENPSFEVISPLLSRTKVYVLEALTTPQIVELLRRALEDAGRGLGNENVDASEEVLFRIAAFANGDARAAYNTLELCVKSVSQGRSAIGEQRSGRKQTERRDAEYTETEEKSGKKVALERKSPPLRVKGGAPSSSGEARRNEGQEAQAGVPVPRTAPASGGGRCTGVKRITVELLEDVLQRKILRYDKAGEEHYNLISALHKSVRNSDPDAALYWLARMIESGEDPLYLARRMVRMASEDIGLAEPGALAVTLAAKEAFDFLGAPEGHLALAQAAVYLSLAPKSNALYAGYGDVMEDVRKTEAEPVPLHLRNAVTGLMKHIGYGDGYKCAHDFEDKVTEMQCLPDNLVGREYYRPTDQGFEARLRVRMAEIAKTKSKKLKRETVDE